MNSEFYYEYLKSIRNEDSLSFLDPVVVTKTSPVSMPNPYRGGKPRKLKGKRSKKKKEMKGGQ